MSIFLSFVCRLLFRRCLPFSNSISAYCPQSRCRLVRLVSANTRSNAESNGRVDIDFSDAKEALKTKSSVELLKSYLIYTLFKYDIIVDNSLRVSKGVVMIR